MYRQTIYWRGGRVKALLPSHEDAIVNRRNTTIILQDSNGLMTCHRVTLAAYDACPVSVLAAHDRRRVTGVDERRGGLRAVRIWPAPSNTGRCGIVSASISLKKLRGRFVQALQAPVHEHAIRSDGHRLVDRLSVRRHQPDDSHVGAHAGAHYQGRK